MTTWNLVIRAAGPSPTYLSLYGSETELEARAKVATSWGDSVEYLGPRLGIARQDGNVISLTSLKDVLKDRLKDSTAASPEERLPRRKNVTSRH